MPREWVRQKVRRYSLEFKLKAVKLSQLKGVEVQAVADALEIHPVHAVALAKRSTRRRVARARVGAEGREGAGGARDEAVPGAAAGACAAPGGACPPKKTHPVHLRTKADVFAFIEEERGRFGVTRLCRLFAVTRAGFYAWRRRPVSARRRQDRALLEEMRAIFEDSGGTYGSPRIQQALTGARAPRQSSAGGAAHARRTVSGPAWSASIGGKAGRASVVQSAAESRAAGRRRPARIRSGSAT